MRKERSHIAETPDEDPREDDEADPESFLEKFPSHTIQAVPPNETTAGVEVTLYDLDEIDEPCMVELHQDYPDEDEPEGESVWIHGEYAILSVASVLSGILRRRFDEDPWPDENGGG